MTDHTQAAHTETDTPADPASAAPKTEADIQKLFEEKNIFGLEDQLISVGIPQGTAEKIVQDYQQFSSQENDAGQELKRLKDEKLKLQQELFSG